MLLIDFFFKNILVLYLNLYIVINYKGELKCHYHTKTQGYATLSAEEEELIHLFRQFPTEARTALLNLVQKSLHLKR